MSTESIESSTPSMAASDAPEATVQTMDSAGSAAEAVPTENASAESKPDIPAKFLKADGTPDYEKLAKSYVGLEKKLGSKPNIPASSVDEYEYDFGDFDAPEENVAQFKQMAFDKGFTKEQYQFVMDSHKNVIQNMVWSADKTEAVLKGEWAGDFEANTNAARKAFEEFAPSDANPNDPVWNHPAVMKLMARMGAELGEDSIQPKGKGGSGMSIEEQIKALRNDPDYYSPAKQAQMHALYAKLK